MARPETGFDPIESLAAMEHEFGEHGGVNMSIEASTTFTVMEARTMPDIFQGRTGPDSGCYLYGRHFNPTVYVLGRELAAIECTESAYACASGMGAISATLVQLCSPGDHIICSDTVYGGTYALAKDFLPKKMGIEVSFVDISDEQAVQAAFTDRTRVLFTETLANPTLKVAPLDRLAALAHDRGAQLVVDNTFSPMLVTPALHGADVVVHSLTKYMNGASDIVAGAICGRTEFIQSLMDLHEGALMLLGATMDPKVAFNISLRLPHLGLRMREHSQRGLVFAQRLEELGYEVSYPGLKSHPGHDTLQRIGRAEYGAGGILALDMKTAARAAHLMEALQSRKFGYMAVSLGYFDTLMSASASSTSSEMGDEAKAQAGLSDGLVRLSLGYTGSVEQRWQQMQETLAEVEAALPLA